MWVRESAVVDATRKTLTTCQEDIDAQRSGRAFHYEPDGCDERRLPAVRVCAS